jgi:hypothetical protein
MNLMDGLWDDGMRVYGGDKGKADGLMGVMGTRGHGGDRGHCGSKGLGAMGGHGWSGLVLGGWVVTSKENLKVGLQ